MAKQVEVGLLISMAAGAAHSGLSMLRENSLKLKSTLDQVRLNRALIGDFQAAKNNWLNLERTGSDASRALAVKAGKHFMELSAKMRAAGLDARNLGQEMRKLNAQQMSANVRLAGTKLSESGAMMREQAQSKAVQTAATGYALFKPVSIAASFQDQVKDIAITGNMSAKEEMGLGQEIRRLSKTTNQTQEELARGVGIMIANGMKPAEAQRYAQILGDGATASRASMEDMANLMFMLSTQMKIKDEGQMRQALDAMAHAGKQGQFELKQMARYFPELGAQMASFGGTGLSAVKELGMAMQVARKYSGTNEEAARNTANWFSHMTANSTKEHFGKVGIDYQDEVMKKMNSGRGISAMQATLEVVDNYVDKVAGGEKIEIKDKKGKIKETIDFRTALEKAAKAGNEAEVRSLTERFGLSKVLQDMQTVNFYLAMRQGKEMMKQGMASYDNDDARDVMSRDKARRMESPLEKFKELKIAGIELGIALGEAFMPLVDVMLPLVRATTEWISSFSKANPVLTRWAAGALLGVGAMGILGIALKWVAGGVATMVAPLIKAVGWFLRIPAVASFVSGAFVMLKSKALLALGGLKAGFGWLGVALKGLGLVGGVAFALLIGAVLLWWKNWDGIVGGAKALWEDLTGFFKKMPDDWRGIGIALVQGLINGIKHQWGFVKDCIGELAGAVKGWFAGPLKIQSPSRVFMGFGGHIGDGLALGIGARAGVVKKAASGLAAATLIGAAAPALAAGAPGAAGGGITLNFSPTINAADVAGVRDALSTSQAELERMLNRVLADRQRRSLST